jgi:hypothetical protein
VAARASSIAISNLTHFQPINFKEIKPRRSNPSTAPQRARRVKSESSRPRKPSKARKVRFEEKREPGNSERVEEDYEEEGIYDTLPNIEADSKGKKKKGRSWSFR